MKGASGTLLARTTPFGRGRRVYSKPSLTSLAQGLECWPRTRRQNETRLRQEPRVQYSRFFNLMIYPVRDIGGVATTAKLPERSIGTPGLCHRNPLSAPKGHRVAGNGLPHHKRLLPRRGAVFIEAFPLRIQSSGGAPCAPQLLPGSGALGPDHGFGIRYCTTAVLLRCPASERPLHSAGRSFPAAGWSVHCRVRQWRKW